ncbi:MAG: right-handed parallel beta-helix repeat-containing protein [Butyribacter sp.]|nr:right-handed parallel beta-helix repeat-containing protein [bacterium]MDY3855411.1 right-handed parallel beta-helix repeat-containing protein [Butyribacter sp.]
MLDNLTKFNRKKKLWMTPKHPLYTKSAEYKVMYGAAVFMQAELNCLSSPLNNFELERLLLAGFQLEEDEMAKVLRYSKEKEYVIDFLLQNFVTEREKFFLLLDMFNVSLREGGFSEKEEESVSVLAQIFQVSSQKLLLLKEFVISAGKEDVAGCRESLHRMHLSDMELTPVDMKYYIMQLWETLECTQEMLCQEKEVRIVDRCQIKEDLVLEKGMRLIFDHAEVRVHGNILLNGGELWIVHSKIIRKSDSHRACVNMKSVYSRIIMHHSEADCRNFGMFIRAEAGMLEIEKSFIYHTTRGAAIRFWGNDIKVTDTAFSECYSPEDGGAIMIRTPHGEIRNCKFKNCEAKRGGAIFAVEGNVITHCTFKKCYVAEYGAAVFYHGFVRANVHHLQYEKCCPEGAETVQYLAKMETFQITGDYRIMVSTIVDCPLLIEATGSLVAENASIYLNYPIRCRGSLEMKRVKVISSHIQEGDMIILEHSRKCVFEQCELNGMGKNSGVFASGCRMTAKQTVFRNMVKGRAIYDAYAPEITECTFNFCQDGGIYSQDGTIQKCMFVNCRSKNGAGISMYGKRGNITGCRFRRCVADYTGGAIDRNLGQKVTNCRYKDCKPNDVS